MSHQNPVPLKRYGIIALVLLVVAFSWYGPITERAQASVDAGLQRSLVSFASARALNGAISFFQGTEVSAQPLGVGVTFSVGEALDPLNDLVESFSSLMLMSSVAFGLEKLLLAMGSNGLVSGAVSAFALGWIILFARGIAPPGLTRFLLVLIFIRFVMPVTLIASDQVFQHWLAKDYSTAQASMEETTRVIRAFEPDAATTPQATAPDGADPASAPARGDSTNDGSGAFARLWEAAKAKAASLATGSVAQLQNGVLAQYEALAQATDRAARRMIDLIVVFLMQTLVVPLILLWALYCLAPARRLPDRILAHS